MASNYEHRKAAKTLKLVTADGSPIKNQEVVIAQTKHKFLFGSAGFDSVPLANGELVGKDKEIAETRFQKFFDIFNYCTLPFYWGRFEPEEGKPDTARLKKGAEYVIKNGAVIKGHPLCWHTSCADWLMNYSNEDILKIQLERIHRDMTEFAGTIDIWDVINEVVIMPIFDRYDNAITRICKDLGRVGLIKEVFAAARKANPKATLLLNDFNTSTNYEILIDGCLNSGVPIDAIGIQSHMHQGYWGAEKTHQVLERFDHFGLPLHFTENTIVSGHLMPPEFEDLNDYQIKDWVSTPQGEERQAREVETHYRTLFEHPQVQSITWWDFFDGQWLGAPSGLIHKDGTSKPAYEVVHNLIKKEWWTAPTKLATDETGAVSVSGFKGEYEIICGGKKLAFTLDSDMPAETIVF